MIQKIIPGWHFLLMLVMLLPAGLNAQVGRDDGREILVDTTRRDTGLIQRPEREVKPDTRLVLPDKIFAHRPHIIQPKYDIGRQHHFDKKDSLQGFHQTLGQIGKPYQVFRFGFESRHFEHQKWRNPVYGRYNMYVLDPSSQIPYHDTKTPYVNLGYMQGGRKLQQLDGVISQNISPELNFTGFYQSRRSDGAYRFASTRNRSMAPAIYYRSKKRRYHLFANGTFTELTNEINGGMNRPWDLPLQNTFLKTAETPNLDAAEHKRVIRGLYMDQYYHLLGHEIPAHLDTAAYDSLKRIRSSTHKLTLRLKGAIDGTYQRFRDKGVNISRISASFVTPYPTLDPNGGDIDESYATTGYHIHGSGSYSFERPAFQANVAAGVGYDAYKFRKLEDQQTDGRTSQWAKARLDINGINLAVEGNARVESSTLFEAETHTTASLFFRPLLNRPTYELLDTLTVGPEGLENNMVTLDPDSTVTDSFMYKIKSFYPMTLDAEIGFHNQNPSYFQKYFQGSEGNLYMPNPDLKNQQFLRVNGGLSFEGGKPVFLGDTLYANKVGIRAFFTRAGRFVYYSPALEVLQAEEGQGLTWVGAEVHGRYRFFRKMYFEGQVTVQQGSTTATGDLERYARHIPQIHGKASMYYDNHSLSFAGMVRTGVDVHFFTSYQAQGVDALSGEFFPTNYIVEPYPRVDLYFSTQVKRAYIFAKILHVNEGIFKRGYYTTPFYPEMERTFVFGVNWSFFD